MMEVVVTTGAIDRAKLQSNHHHQQTITQFFYRPDAHPVANSVKALKGKLTFNPVNPIKTVYDSASVHPCVMAKHATSLICYSKVM